jgi:hypothetical protein
MECWSNGISDVAMIEKTDNPPFRQAQGPEPVEEQSAIRNQQYK